ncbi:hypothetical protein ACHAWT_008280 [Skeletonema menzelii]|mmetsp:Transcript_27179/g.44120  ORF Transcript_27179/g.44120 Transcript_27179/m.44120 type:complete len:94 (-) Transcript_27179:802-1083(-)
MIGSTLARVSRPVVARQQRRGIVNWMTNYPDKVMEIKKIQMKGGTCQGEYAPTWLKQEGDTFTLAIGAALLAWGTVSCSVGYYRLATGKGKKE